MAMKLRDSHEDKINPYEEYMLEKEKEKVDKEIRECKLLIKKSREIVKKHKAKYKK